MTILDLTLVLILFFFTFSGFFFGAIHTLGALLGTIAGVLVSGHYFEMLADKINPVPIANLNLAKVVAFIIIFIIASRLVGLLFLLIDKIFKVLTFIPFLKAINRLAGAVFGVVEGAVVLGVVLVFIGKFPFADFLIPAIGSSVVAQWLLRIGDILVPLLPEIVKQVKGVI